MARTTRMRHAVAIFTAAAVLATMTAATVAAPASAAKPKCAGKVATIVGTKKGEIIRGTRKADVIVARGGHDKIYGRGGNDLICAGLGNDLVAGGPGADRVYGQAGRDKLYGGPGPDWLAGQLDNDTLVGGIGVDTCHQGPGDGPWLTCELPVPEPPTLVIAYSDVNTNHVYDTGDVMIAKIVDTITDGAIGPGDTILTSQYPTSPSVIKLAQLRSQFEDWQLKGHTVTTGDMDVDPDDVYVQSGPNLNFYWSRMSGVQEYDFYVEDGPTYDAEFWDDRDPGDEDGVYVQLGSPSLPISALAQSAYNGIGDDGFIDVEIFVP